MKLLKSILLVCLLSFISIYSVKANEMPMNDNDNQNTFGTMQCIIKGNQVQIVNGAKQEMRVYKITGEPAAKYYIDCNNKTITLDFQQGIYLVKIGKIARKVSL